MSPLLLLKDLIESVSPAAGSRITVLASVLVRRAPPGYELDARPLAVTRRAGRGRGGQGEWRVDGIRGDAERAGGVGGSQDSSRAAPQLPEAGALLQASSSTHPGAMTLQWVGPRREEEGLGAVMASCFTMSQGEGGVRVRAVHDVPERERERLDLDQT